MTAFSAGTVRRKGLTLVLERPVKEMYERANGWVADGRLGVYSIGTGVFALADSQRAFEVEDAREGLKIVIDPSRL